MSARRTWLALAALLCLAAPASAQDALGGNAAFDDEWEAILKLAPPASGAAASDEAPKKGGRAHESDASGERARAKERDAAGSERKKERAASSEKEGESTRGARGKARGESSAQAEAREPSSSKSAARGAKTGKVEGEPAARDGADELLGSQRESGKGESKRSSDESGKSGVPSSYEELVHSWHQRWPAHAGDQAVDMLAGAEPVLVVHPVGKVATPYVLLPNNKDGGFNEAQITVASQAFGSWPGGPNVSPRLLDLIYHAARHFKVFHIHLISGVRNDRSGSRHSHGLAADIVFPGVSDEELAAYFRPQGFLGVGIYTRAGFVHVDVRERSYFWLDKSPPGKRTKIIPVRGEEAKMADEAALLRGQTGYVNPLRLQKALHARAKRRMEKARASQ